MKYKYGWGDCSVCGRDIAVTKYGLAVRHKFRRYIVYIN